MIKTALGAKRYNNKMDKIWQQAREAQEKAKPVLTAFYKRAYKHLLKTNKQFYTSKAHGLVSREDCRSWLSFNI